MNPFKYKKIKLIRGLLTLIITSALVLCIIYENILTENNYETAFLKYTNNINEKEILNSKNIKLISNISNSINTENIQLGLNDFYNTLERTNDYIYETNNFNCTKNGCNKTNFNNIGLLSAYEYNLIGGEKSYLSSNNNYFLIEENEIKNLTDKGIEKTTNETVSGLRPTIYLQNDVSVIGSGTANDPYMLSTKGDLILAGATLNGSPLDDFPGLSEPYIVKGVKCSNGSEGYYDEKRGTIRLTTINLPTTCIVDFKEGHTVSLTAKNGIVTAPSSKVVGRDGIKTFNVTPESGYTLKDSTYTCTNGAIPTLKGNTLTIKNIKKDTECNITMQKEITSLYTKLLENNKTILTRTNFDSVFAEDNTGTLYKARGNETEDGSNVYYFAGNAQNNWVKFGKDQDNADLYWRIIRTNEDGSVRLLYIGPDPSTENAFISIDGKYMSGGSATTGMYNSTYNNTMYVGYMYGEEGSLANNRQNTKGAPIKTVTDLWYSKTLNVKKDSKGNLYDTYVSKTAIYCNDRSGDAYASSGYMAYGAYNRLYHNNKNGRKPTYKCGYNAAGGYTTHNGSSWIWNTKAVGMYSDASVADKFSVSTSKGGNGKLTYPIAQITADEIAYAGGKYGTNAPAWYYYNSTGGSAVGSDYWWTMSPSDFRGSNVANVFYVNGSSYPGNLDYWYVNYTNPGVRPVVSLKSCVHYLTGDGSSDSPYEVNVDNTCVSKEN